MTGVVMLVGDPEYDSHLTMPTIADEWRRRLGVDVRVHASSVVEDEPDFPLSTFGDLSDLADAALLVVYTRFRRIPDDEVAAIDGYLRRGGAVLGLRTANHAFRLAEDSPWHDWGAAFGRDVLGSPWISHHGHSSRTDVTVADDAPAALVAGLPPSFRVRSWLYVTDLAPWCRPVLHGVPVDPETPPVPGPVAWYGDNAGRRTFHTSLGHPDDLAAEPVRDLLAAGVRWAVGL